VREWAGREEEGEESGGKRKGGEDGRGLGSVADLGDVGMHSHWSKIVQTISCPAESIDSCITGINIIQSSPECMILLVKIHKVSRVISPDPLAGGARVISLPAPPSAARGCTR
jgi:hypothetical protein